MKFCWNILVLVLLYVSMSSRFVTSAAGEDNECTPKIIKTKVQPNCQKRLFKCPTGSIYKSVCAYCRQKCKYIHKIYSNNCIMDSQQECKKYVFKEVPFHCCAYLTESQ